MSKCLRLPACLMLLSFGYSVTPIVALAQSDMSCADYLKAEAQMQAAMSPADKAQMQTAMQSDPQAAALDAKMKAYCKANPNASSSDAMMKVTQ